jgi:hypothetical protein
MDAVPSLAQLRRAVGPGDPLGQLATVTRLADALRARSDELLDEFVDAARAAGVSWTEIGCVLGTSKQAAQQRFAALADPAPGQAPFGLTGTGVEVLELAVAQARELGHHYVRPEHLVLGLLGKPEELAAQVLARLGVTADSVRAQVTEQLGTGPPRPDGSLGVSPQTKRLLELARAIAKSLGHRCPKTEHVLLAATSPKLDSSSAALLSACGAAPDRVRDELSRMLLAEAPELAERVRLGSRRARFRMRGV